MQFNFHDERLTLKEVARLARVHVATVWRWVLTGVRGKRLPTLRIGGRRWVLRRHLDDFFAEESRAVARAQPSERDEDIERQLRDAGLMLEEEGRDAKTKPSEN